MRKILMSYKISSFSIIYIFKLFMILINLVLYIHKVLTQVKV